MRSLCVRLCVRVVCTLCGALCGLVWLGVEYITNFAHSLHTAYTQSHTQLTHNPHTAYTQHTRPTHNTHSHTVRAWQRGLGSGEGAQPPPHMLVVGIARMLYALVLIVVLVALCIVADAIRRSAPWIVSEICYEPVNNKLSSVQVDKTKPRSFASQITRYFVVMI